jgi:phage protein U
LEVVLRGLMEGRGVVVTRAVVVAIKRAASNRSQLSDRGCWRCEEYCATVERVDEVRDSERRVVVSVRDGFAAVELRSVE